MSHTKTNRRNKQIPLVPRLKVWLEAEGNYAFGFGLAEILQAVDQAGSIKQAASNLGKSYRYVWGRIKKAEEALGHQLVETYVGGKDTQRSFLAPPARQLVDDFLAIRSRMMDIVERECRRRFSWPIAGGSGNE